MPLISVDCLSIVKTGLRHWFQSFLSRKHGELYIMAGWKTRVAAEFPLWWVGLQQTAYMCAVRADRTSVQPPTESEMPTI